MLALLTAALVALPGGARGTVLIDPALPVCAVDAPCGAPDRHDMLAFWRGGRRFATAATDGRGRYFVVLPAGRYTVTTPRRRAGIGRGLSPKAIVVRRGRFVRADFTLDIGIR